MSQVYTFCRTNGSNGSNGSNYKPKVSEPVSSANSGYNFKRAGTNSSTEPVENKPIEINDMNFPALGGPKGPVVTSKPKESCWSNPEMREIIREPFKATPVAPRRDIPPLFAKAKKTVKRRYVDDDGESYSDEDDEYMDQMDYENSSQDEEYGGYEVYQDNTNPGVTGW